MNNATLEASTSLPSDRLAFGTSRRKGHHCVQLVQAAISVGYRRIDTAESYQNEEAVGIAIRSSLTARSDIHLTTKLHLASLTKDAIPLAVERSLKKLKTDYIDLLLIHWPNPTVLLTESLEAMEKERLRGTIRSIGVSNFTPQYLDQAAGSSVRIVCNQIELHPYLQQRIIQEATTARDMQLLAYRPLAGGIIQNDPLLNVIGERYNKTAIQVALRWHVQSKDRAAVVGCSNLEQVTRNWEIWDFCLAEDELQAIDNLDRGLRTVTRPYAPSWT